MIKRLANPYVLAFFGPGVLVFLLVFVSLSVPSFELSLLRKSVEVDLGGMVRRSVFEGIYISLGAVSSWMQSNWISWVVTVSGFSKIMVNALVAANMAALVAIPVLIFRWCGLYFKTQSEVQALQADRDFLKR